MKNINITLHPLSVLTGMALLGFGLIATGAFAPQGSSGGRDVSATESVDTFNPKASVRFTSDAPFVVPSGKVFIPTMCTKDSSSSEWMILSANGVVQLEVNVYQDLVVIPNDPAYPAGTSMTCSAFGNRAIFYGYLVDA